MKSEYLWDKGGSQHLLNRDFVAEDPYVDVHAHGRGTKIRLALLHEPQIWCTTGPFLAGTGDAKRCEG
jgi:hypothetical protein